MNRLLLVFTLFLFANVLSAQVDSLVVSDTLSMDTLEVDTIQTDSIVLDTPAELEAEEEVLVKWVDFPGEDTVKVEDVAIVRHDAGRLLLSAKIGFSDDLSNTDWTGYSIKTIAPIAIQVDYFDDDFWSYGAQLFYGRNKYVNDTLTTTSFKNTTLGLAAIGTFHYGAWLEDITHDLFRMGHLDLYASMALRLDLHHDVEDGAWNEELQKFESGVRKPDTYVKMRMRPIFGARYYISDRFSMNIELGRGNLGMITSSVSWVL